MPAGPFEAMLASAASRMSRRASSGVRRTRLPADTHAAPALLTILFIVNIFHGNESAVKRTGTHMPVSSSTAPSGDDPATVIAVGALAAILATLCHETLGHGLGCFGSGGHITLLTSVWFRCSKGSAISDAG